MRIACARRKRVRVCNVQFVSLENDGCSLKTEVPLKWGSLRQTCRVSKKEWRAQLPFGSAGDDLARLYRFRRWVAANPIASVIVLRHLFGAVLARPQVRQIVVAATMLVQVSHDLSPLILKKDSHP